MQDHILCTPLGGGYVPESQTFPELSNGIYITLKLTPKDANSQEPDQKSETPSDDTNNPNTGSPPDDSGTQTPGPEDFGCLGGDCGTPNDCLTPPPSDEEAPDDSGGKPSPANGLRESIIERVQRQITETWNRVLNGLGGNNPNLKPPDFAN